MCVLFWSTTQRSAITNVGVSSSSSLVVSSACIRLRLVSLFRMQVIGVVTISQSERFIRRLPYRTFHWSSEKGFYLVLRLSFICTGRVRILLSSSSSFSDENLDFVGSTVFRFWFKKKTTINKNCEAFFFILRQIGTQNSTTTTVTNIYVPYRRWPRSSGRTNDWRLSFHVLKMSIIFS